MQGIQKLLNDPDFNPIYGAGGVQQRPVSPGRRWPGRQCQRPSRRARLRTPPRHASFATSLLTDTLTTLQTPAGRYLAAAIQEHPCNPQLRRAPSSMYERGLANDLSQFEAEVAYWF